MLPTPTTRASLLLRLKDHDDQEAWNEFLEIYQPILYRMARRRGYQDADSREIVQNVLVAITKNISSFAPRNETGSFRAWLATMVRNQTINLFQRHAKLRSIGGSDFAHFVSQQADHRSDIESDLEMEHRRQLFHWAAERVQKQVGHATWQSFWQTCVLAKNIHQVADELKMSIGSIYVSRSRVIARMKSEIEHYESSVNRRSQ